MVYYRSISGLFAAISRRVRQHYECTLVCFKGDNGKGAIHICHRAKAEKILETIEDILQRVHRYDVETASIKGGKVTIIRVFELSELAGPIPNEFLTTNN